MKTIAIVARFKRPMERVYKSKLKDSPTRFTYERRRLSLRPRYVSLSILCPFCILQQKPNAL